LKGLKKKNNVYPRIVFDYSYLSR